MVIITFARTRGAKVLTGLAIVLFDADVNFDSANLVVIGWIVRSFSVFLAVALVVIFQPEVAAWLGCAWDTRYSR